MSNRDDRRDENRDDRRDENREDRGDGNDDENREQDERYRLTVSLDATHLTDLREQKAQDLQVVGRLPDDTLVAEEVQLEEGKGVATLEFEGQPDTTGLFAGPARATPEELVKTQTITENVSADRWAETKEVKLEPIRIPAYYWEWWYRWCREFVIRGKLVCPDGSPVPGAEVCAKDVDAWFYWSSTEEVGCDITDENGLFEIEFRWCCGFWPWWWWQNRAWRPDQKLLDRVGTAVERDPDLTFGSAGTQPTLKVFDDLLADRPFTADQPLADIDPNQLEQLRSQLVEQLPDAPELRQLHVWPWTPWLPWWDCTPDIIFEATQDGDVVLNEDIGDTRWNISTSENVTLIANEEALCRDDCQDPPCEGGECLLVTKVCGSPIDKVGGNLGAPSSPAGYQNPGSPAAGTSAHNGDRPFGGTVKLHRNVGTLENVDYLEFEVFDGSTWDPVDPDAVEDFNRKFFDKTTWDTDNQPFKFTTIDGHYVVETREHYEANSGYTWDCSGCDRFWIKHRNLLVPIDSEAFADGTHRFRVVGWDEASGSDKLTNRRELQLCGDDEQRDVEVVLTFDNRSKDLSHPHRCGSGSVHTCVTEPDTNIIAVQIDGEEVDEDEEGECPTVEPKDKGTLQIDFLVSDDADPTGHLSHYTLNATYGRSKKINLLAKATSLEPLPPGSSPPPYPGPTYGEALNQGASRPNWEGGRYRLEVPVEEAFPKPCCYQLELRAYKRTIVNCNGGHPHRNRSEYSIGYSVCEELRLEIEELENRIEELTRPTASDL